MKERPILMSAPMVRASLRGENPKTQTRRALNVQPLDIIPFGGEKAGVAWVGHMQKDPPAGVVFGCRFGQPGDRLWVREAWSTHACFDGIPPSKLTTRSIHYSADGQIDTGKGRHSIHMPRWASRITMEIITVRVDRLQDISEADALSEGIVSENVIVGCNCYGGHHVEESADRYFFDGCAEEGFESAVDAYAGLWESINGPGSWAANPWVWVLEFRRL